MTFNDRVKRLSIKRYLELRTRQCPLLGPACIMVSSVIQPETNPIVKIQCELSLIVMQILKRAITTACSTACLRLATLKLTDAILLTRASNLSLFLRTGFYGRSSAICSPVSAGGPRLV